MPDDKKKILVYGAGAIGSTVGGWLAQKGEDITMLARGQNAVAIQSKGLITYQIGHESESTPVAVKVIANAGDMRDPDIIILTVKNYDLKSAAEDIRKSIGGDPIVIALQNGMDNQKILPKYFNRII